MAVLDFILQGLDENIDHFASIRRLFLLPNITRGLIASAFMNAAGASMIADAVAPLSDRTTVFIGIRNGITTIQGIELLKERNIYPYLVDTATQSFIFHPKIYLFCNRDTAQLISGSANMTTGGLVKNIEASVTLELDLAQENDAHLVQDIFSAFQLLADRYPDNVFQLNDTIDLREMVAQGLLEDEHSATWRATARAAGNRAQLRERMRLRTRRFPRTRRAVAEPTATVNIPGTDTGILAIGNTQLLWRSSELTRRDLNIPTGPNTNPTGSMLLKKGDATQDIDPRSYFREHVFVHAAWAPDPQPGKAHLERCHARFRVVVKGIDYGVHDLQLTHNTRTDTAAYLQHNSMTQIHWGPDVRALVAREDLLDCFLSLYAPEEGDNVFTVVLDEE